MSSDFHTDLMLFKLAVFPSSPLFIQGFVLQRRELGKLDKTFVKTESQPNYGD